MLDKMRVRDKHQRTCKIKKCVCVGGHSFVRLFTFHFPVLLRGVWRKSLYVTLVKGAVVRGDGEMALFMLGEMRGWGFSMTTKAYEHLFQLVRSAKDLDQYLMVSIAMLCVECPKLQVVVFCLFSHC